MSIRRDWNKAVLAGYFGAMLMYTPIAIVGYLVYGSFLGSKQANGTILGAILSFDPQTEIVTKVCSVIMVVHILSAYPVVTNPIFLAVESKIMPTDPDEKETKSQLVRRLLIRVLISAVLILMALFVRIIPPAFSPFLFSSLTFWILCH